MSLRDRLLGIFDAFSRRATARGSTYNVGVLLEQTRRRILILYRDVIAGQWQANRRSPSGNYTEEFRAQVTS